jgi:hypothetical protein
MNYVIAASPATPYLVRTIRQQHPLLPPIVRQVGLDTGRSGGQDACQARAAPAARRLDRFTFLLGGVSGSSAHDQHPGTAGHLSRGQGSHRAANLIAATGSPQRLDRPAYPLAAVCGRR